MINQRGIGLKNKKSVQYTVERKFLSKFSAEELLVRIIGSRLKQQEEKR